MGIRGILPRLFSEPTYSTQGAIAFLVKHARQFSISLEIHLEQKCISTLPGNVQLLRRFAIRTDMGERTDGYVAIDHTNQAIIASFSSVASGNRLFYTHFNAEFFTNRQAQFEGSDGLVNRFLYESWFKLWYLLGMERTLKAVVENNTGFEVWFIGHSLGGAKAEMSVVSVLLKKLVPQDKVRLLTFGATRVGDMSFVNLIEALVPYRFRIVHGRDMVPRYPRKFDGEWTPPHHHRYEVWYPNGMGVGARYFVCLGAEDPQCSTRLSPWEIRAADNDIYFERSMQHWAKSFCNDSMMYDTPRPTTFANIREPIYDMSSIRTTRPTMATIPTTSAHPLIINSRLFPFWDLLTIPYDKTTKKATTTESTRTTTSMWVIAPTTTSSPSTTYFNIPPTMSTTLPTTPVVITSTESPQDQLSNVTLIDHFPETRISNMSTRPVANDTGLLSEKGEAQDKIESLLSLR
ncbi:triacylglycerol lipase [Ostertagia ostertagi]